MKLKLIHELVKFILLNANSFQWSLQGLGMLRLHLPGDTRLNIWDSRFRVPGVSPMHSHPWFFRSVVVSGHLANVRYVEGGPDYYSAALIKPGPKGGLIEPLPTKNLRPLPTEHYSAGSVYQQEPDELHISLPSDGCITLNTRVRFLEDVAVVCWPRGEKWVSAEPRQAGFSEVNQIVSAALNVMGSK